MNGLNKLIAPCIVFWAGCAMTDDGTAAPDDVSTDGISAADDMAEQDVAAAPAPTADSAATAPPHLYGPSIASAGSSSASALPPSSSGPGLVIHGGGELGSFALATYSRPVTALDATGRFTVTARAGASFVYNLRGTGSSYSKRQLRIERLPRSTTLQATASTGVVACGSVASDRPTGITLAFHAASLTFDVLIDGTATACTGLQTAMKAPVVGFSAMDASNEGYGGQVELTDLSLQ